MFALDSNPEFDLDNIPLDTVVAIFWARVLCHLALQGAHFRVRITLGVILIRSLACAICVSGRLRSGSGVALNKRVHEKVIKAG